MKVGGYIYFITDANSLLDYRQYSIQERTSLTNFPEGIPAEYALNLTNNFFGLKYKKQTLVLGPGERENETWYRYIGTGLDGTWKKAEIGGNLNVSEKILWENPNPKAQFSAQKITLNDNIENYDCYSVLIIADSAAEKPYLTKTPNYDVKDIINFSFREVGNSGEGIYRNFSNIYGKNIDVGDAKVNATTTNQKLVPFKIIGYNYIQTIINYIPDEVFETINETVTIEELQVKRDGRVLQLYLKLRTSLKETDKSIGKLKIDFVPSGKYTTYGPLVSSVYPNILGGSVWINEQQHNDEGVIIVKGMEENSSYFIYMNWII